MRQCHFYEVGVKKIYSLFQKAFFFFPREKGVESLRGFYGLHCPTLFAPLLCSFIFMSLLEDKAWLVEDLGLPMVSTLPGWDC